MENQGAKNNRALAIVTGQLKIFFALPSVRTGAVVYALLTGSLLAVPLFNILGYEFSAAISLAASVVAGYITIAMYKRDAADCARESPEQFFGIYRNAVFTNAALLLIPFLIISAGKIFIENCAYTEGMLYYLIYPLVTIFVACGIAAFIAAARMHRPRTWFMLVWLATMAYHALVAYFNPALFTYWWAAGYFPGLQYDMTMRITDTLLLARAASMVGALALLLGGAMLAGTKIPNTLVRITRASREALRMQGTSVITGILLAASIFAFTFRCELGFERTHAFIGHTLDEVYQTEHFTFLFAKGSLAPRRLQWLADRSEYFYDCDAHYFPPPADREFRRIAVFLYPPGAKQSLLGSRSTSFTKPWLQEIHLDLGEFDGVFPHELVHAMCAPYGIPILNTSANMGLEEGIAVALDNIERGQGEELDRDALGIIRDLPANSFDKVFSRTGFAFGNVEANYRVAGSFSKYLLTKFGAEKFRRAFMWADFDAFGFSLDELRQDWLATLSHAGVSAPPAWAISHSYGSTFLFSTTCAHYVANTIDNAERFSTDGFTARAISILEDLLVTHPNRDALNALLHEFLARCEFDSVETIYRRFLPADSSYTRGATALYRGDVTEAAAMFARVNALDPAECTPELDLRMRICGIPALLMDTDVKTALRQMNYEGVASRLSDTADTTGMLRSLCLIAEARKRAQWGEFDSSETVLENVIFHDMHSIGESASQPGTAAAILSAHSDGAAYRAYCRTKAENLLRMDKTENAAQFLETVRHSIDIGLFERDLAPMLRFAMWKLRRTANA